MKNAFVLATVCALLGSVSGQVDSTALRATFGNPTAESFKVLPDANMTVSYASNGEVCMLLVRPDKPTHYADRMATSQMLEEAVKKAVPVDLWGAKSEFEMTVINGCAGFKTTKYENVEVRKAIFSDVNPTCTAQMEVEVKFTHNRCATSHNENISQ